jgi:hypothetical protein
MLTAGLYVVPFFLDWSVVNSVAWAVGSTQALPATTIVLLLLIWLLIGFPLTVVGGILGKNHAGLAGCVCRVCVAGRPSFPAGLGCIPCHHHPTGAVDMRVRRFF